MVSEDSVTAQACEQAPVAFLSLPACAAMRRQRPTTQAASAETTLLGKTSGKWTAFALFGALFMVPLLLCVVFVKTTASWSAPVPTQRLLNTRQNHGASDLGRLCDVFVQPLYLSVITREWCAEPLEQRI